MVRGWLLAAVLPAAAALSAAVPADTMTGILDPTFASLQAYPEECPLMPPVVRLDDDRRLTVCFDELAEEPSWLRYSLMLCDANWQPSQLIEPEWLEGFNDGNVTEYDYSRGTTVHYVHYCLALPDGQMAWTKPGNYLLRVWRDGGDPDEPVLQTRFMVSEGTADVRATVRTVTDVDYNDAHQQIDVTVDTSRANVADPYNDLKVYVSQNGRRDNEVCVRQPLKVVGATAYYEHLPQLIFPAGKEYRRMETVSVTYPGMGVEEISWHDPYYHATLYTDTPRAEQSYVYDRTQHGRFKIREYNSADSDTEADYLVTHFTLDAPGLPPGTAVYLDGDFTSRRFDQGSRMVYNPATGLYERALLLKQGAYNYQYLAVTPGATRGDTAPVEGNSYRTGNEYLITVYARGPHDRYDRLIGTTVITL